MRRRWLTRRRLVVIATLLAVLVAAGVGDALLRRYVEARIEREVAAATGGQVDAHVEGWPVALMLARDDLDGVRGTVRGARADVRGEQVTVDAELDAREVTGLLRATGRAQTVTGRVSTSWADLSRATGVTLSGADDGMLTLTTTVPVLGERLPVTVTGRPLVDGATGQLGLNDPGASLDGVAVPDDVVAGLLPRVATRAQLPVVPGLTWAGVHVGDEGATLDVRGEGVTIPRR